MLCHERRRATTVSYSPPLHPLMLARLLLTLSHDPNLPQQLHATGSVCSRQLTTPYHVPCIGAQRALLVSIRVVNMHPNNHVGLHLCGLLHPIERLHRTHFISSTCVPWLVGLVREREPVTRVCLAALLSPGTFHTLKCNSGTLGRGGGPSLVAQ